jgi:starch synthase (maltosyl-transferring)
VVKKNDTVPLIIYNLFPRHFTNIDEWSVVLPRIAAMGFNAVFVNPFFETGFSGSLYAIKDHYRLNPLFLKKGQDGADFAPIDRFNEACARNGLDLYIDLVINHTAFDAVLTKTRPSWYKCDASGKPQSPYAVDPGDASKVTVWGDLATIDNENSPDRETLWSYWDALIAFFQKRGIHGFRCDAAYQVPVALWEKLIAEARRRDRRAAFLAETLGCRLDQIEALAPAGFDYLFNSVKWWNYDAPWAIEQHTANRHIAPSIAFPESHDTDRLAAELPGTIAVQKSRFAFAALFSKGLLMPMGFEHGAVTRMDVVRGTPHDVDAPQWDLSDWIGFINNLKCELPALASEGTWRTLCPFTQPFLFLEKTSDDGSECIYVCVNKSMVEECVVEEWMIPDPVKKCTTAISLLSDAPQWEPMPTAFTLDPADVVIFLDKPAQ